MSQYFRRRPLPSQTCVKAVPHRKQCVLTIIRRLLHVRIDIDHFVVGLASNYLHDLDDEHFPRVRAEIARRMFDGLIDIAHPLALTLIDDVTRDHAVGLLFDGHDVLLMCCRCYDGSYKDTALVDVIVHPRFDVEIYSESTYHSSNSVSLGGGLGV
jgi:hypothetical protein